MARAFGILGILLLLAILALSGVFVTGNAQRVLLWGITLVYGPDGAFDPGAAAAAPDYGSDRYWAARPDLDDPSDLVPAGVAGVPEQGSAPVDLFFIHPTGYLSGAKWVSPMAPDSAAEENTSWMLANQASAFNGCCNVYAPRYREATIFAYFAADEEARDAVLAFAYRDVEAAFDHFIDNFSEGRPFIIASHSQGTHHGMRLLKERIDGTPLAKRMIAAYLVGSAIFPVPEAYLASLRDIHVCANAIDVHCLVHWDTFGEGSGRGESRSADTLCVNPLSWRADNERAEARMSRGAVAVAGVYNPDFSKENAATGVMFDALAAPIAGHTWAQCSDGMLLVADQSETEFAAMAAASGLVKSYHGLDYPLFHMDIRENAVVRAEAFLAAAAAPAGRSQ